MHNCYKCQKVLTNDDVGLHKKLVNRRAVSFMCIDCLAAHFRVERSDLEEKIKLFKDMGCTLF